MNGVIDTEVAWAAGFFDGEGCVTGFVGDGSARKPCGRKRRLQLEVSQASSDEHLQRFQKAIGRGTVAGPTYRSGRSGKSMYRWQASDQEAHVVMGILRPHLCSPKIVKYEEMKTYAGLKALDGDASLSQREVLSSAAEIAWAAGFFDGEGCVTGYTTHFPTKTIKYIALIVSQASTEHLERFKRAVGLGFVQGPYGGKKEHHKPMYRWQQSGSKVHVVMEAMRPFLCSPKLSKYDTMKEGAA